MDFYHFPNFDKAGLTKRISTEDAHPTRRRRNTWPLAKMIEQPRLRFLNIPKLMRYGDLRPAHSIGTLIRNVRERADSPTYVLKLDRQLMNKRGRPVDSEDAKEYNSFDQASRMIAEADGTLF